MCYCFNILVVQSVQQDYLLESYALGKETQELKQLSKINPYHKFLPIRLHFFINNAYLIT